jgi:Na+/proline symporter
MTALDWVVVAVYVAGIVAYGSYFTRRASASGDAYVVAGRKLPWWVVGIADVASADGADAFWITVIATGAMVGIHRFFWIGAVVSAPLAILWSRYWRRLALTSAAEIFEARYDGVAASRFRGFFVAYGALFANGIVLAYVLRGFAQSMAPFLGWSGDTVLLVFAGATTLFTAVSGLLGVAYTDVPQFAALMLGRVILAGTVLSLTGGFDGLMDRVVALKGHDFLAPFPPSRADVHGEFGVDAASLVALALGGAFSVATAQSYAVQRALAARSERDAALGQMLNAFLSLVLRIVPLALIAFGCVALVPSTPPSDAWAALVRAHVGPGALGLILVGIVAGYLSTIDGFQNFIVAGLYNDLFARHLRPHASERERVWFLRGATLAVTLVSYLWARVLIGRVDGAWINFIGSVLGLFALPASLLRWVWWRMNIWGEVAAFALGAPLAWAVWFPLGFSRAPYWQGFAILFGVGLVTVIGVALLTPPEAPAVLRAFYLRARPPGLWGPVRATLDDATLTQVRGESRADLVVALSGMVLCGAMVVGLGAVFARDRGLLVGCAAATVASGLAFYRGFVGPKMARPEDAPNSA